MKRQDYTSFRKFMNLAMIMVNNKPITEELLESYFGELEVNDFLIHVLGWDYNKEWTYKDAAEYLEWLRR